MCSLMSGVGELSVLGSCSYCYFLLVLLLLIITVNQCLLTLLISSHLSVLKISLTYAAGAGDSAPTGCLSV